MNCPHENSGLRFVYGRGLARPNPSDMAQEAGQPDLSVNPHTISLGNPDLKAEHGDNFDVLDEQYLNPLGVIQAGFFYKNLSDPDRCDAGETHHRGVRGLSSVRARQRRQRPPGRS